LPTQLMHISIMAGWKRVFAPYVSAIRAFLAAML
jgi:hypothetical protein